MNKRFAATIKIFIIAIISLVVVSSHAQGEIYWDIEEYLEGSMDAFFNAKYKKAIGLGEDALYAIENKFGRDHLNTAAILNNLAALNKIVGRYWEAEKLYKRALAIYENNLGLDNTYSAKVWNALGENYQARRKYREAEKSYKTSQSILEKNYGSGNPSTSILISHLGSLYKDERDYKESEEMLLYSLQSIAAAYGEGHPFLIRVLDDLGRLYEAEGKESEAEQYYRYAWGLFKANFYQEDASVGGALARIKSELERRWSLRNDPIYQRLQDINDFYIGPWHPDAPRIINSLPALYLKQTRYTEAENIYEDYLEIMLSSLGPEHLNIAKVLDNMSKFYKKMGKPEKARDALEKAKIIREKNRD